MNVAAAVSLDSDFFDEKGLPKTYNHPPAQQMIILKRFQSTSNAIHISEDGVEIQHNISTSVLDPVSGSIPPLDFPPVEFPSTEVISQSLIDSPSISDMLHLRETGISLKKGSYKPDFQLKIMEIAASHEEMREIRGLDVSAKPPQSTGDSREPIISDNCTLGKTVPGTKDGKPTVLPVEIRTSFYRKREIP